MIKKRISSFKYAFDGISTGIKDQPNLRFHLATAFIVIALALFFQISIIEWLIVILTISAVITVEFLNTAIEEIVDSFTPTQHPSAKKAKDVAAAAVLVTSVAALFVGIVIFAPYLILYF